MTDRTPFALTIAAGAILGAAAASVGWWVVFLEPMQPRDVLFEHPEGTWWVIHPGGKSEMISRPPKPVSD